MVVLVFVRCVIMAMLQYKQVVGVNLSGSHPIVEQDWRACGMAACTHDVVCGNWFIVSYAPSPILIGRCGYGQAA